LAVRTHAEKGDGFRAVAPQLGRDAFASGDELGGVELLGRGGAAVDEVGDTVAALEQLVLLGRVELSAGKTRQVQRRPEAVAGRAK